MNDIAAQGLTRTLAEQARSLRFDDIPETTRAWARQCILDTVACGIAGASDELVTILLAEMQEQGGKEVASVYGHAAKLSPAAAAIGASRLCSSRLQAKQRSSGLRA